MFVIGFLCYNIAGQLTRWLYEHDVFIVLCFIFILWGISYFPVWIVDWALYKMAEWTEDAKRKANAQKYGHTYTKFKETKKK